MRPSPKDMLKAAARFALLYVIVGPIENAINGWIDWKLGLTNDAVDKTVKLVLQFGLPALTVLILFIAYFLIDFYLFARWRRLRFDAQRKEEGGNQQQINVASKTLTMTEAATRAYEVAREAGSMWAYVAERNVPKGASSDISDDVVLNTMANLIAGKVKVFGAKPPSRIIEEIDTNDQFNNFTNRASEIRRLFGGRILYSNLHVNESDLQSVLDYLRQSHKTDAPI